MFGKHINESCCIYLLTDEITRGFWQKCLHLKIRWFVSLIELSERNLNEEIN